VSAQADGAPEPAAGPARAAIAARERRARWLIAALGVAILVAIAPYVTGLLGAAVLYVVSEPGHRRLARRIGGRWAALVATVVALAAVALPTLWLLSVVFAQAPATIRSMEQSALFERLGTLHVGALDVGAQLAAAGGAVASWLSQQAFRAFGGATRATLNLVIALFGLYYLLCSARALWSRTMIFLPFSHSAAESLRERFHLVTRATLLGILAVALAQGGIVGAAFWLVGLPHAAFWGVVTGIASVLPVLGSGLVWLPGVAVLAADGRYGAAVALAAIGALVASNVDNFIRPMVYRRISDVHPMVTLVGAFAGVSLFGLVGLLLGPLAITYFLELLRTYEREYGTGKAA